jgi:uncharacterized membrane protein YeaQ/YmgE (transglycosylase-associated protein family)
MEANMPGFMVVILMGTAIGFIARLLYPGPNTVHGFVLTTVLGVSGVLLATGLERFFGYSGPNNLAHPLSMIAGAIIMVVAWNLLATSNIVEDPGIHQERNSADTKHAVGKQRT